MTLPPPKIDSRTCAELVTETKELAQKFSQWKADEGKTDAGRALIRIFGRMAAMVSDRLNRVPEKHFLAFLNLIGAQQQPPQPARVPLTAYLVNNSPVDAIVPVRTQIAIVSQSGSTEEVLFETEEELVVVRSQLQAAIVHQGKQYCDHLLTATTAAGDFPVFEIEQPNTLYIAADQLTTKIDSQEIQLAIATPDNLVKEWNWSYWDGEIWQSLTPIPENDRLKLTVTVSAQGWKPPKPKTIEGIEAQWLRGIAPGDLLPLEIHLVRAATGEIVPEQAFFNANEIDLSKDFLPLGETPRFNDIFYIASKNLLSIEKSAITITLTRSDSYPFKQTVGTSEISAPNSTDVQIQWETWNGASWQKVSQPNSTDLNNSVLVTLPDPVAPVEVNGEENYWLRARLIAGNYGKEPQFKTNTTSTSPNTETTLEQLSGTGYFPPSLKSITLSRSELSISPKKLLKALPSGAFIYDDPKSDIYYDPNLVKTIFYIAADQISASPTSTEIKLKKDSIQQWNEWEWSYWNGETWQPVSAKDDGQFVTLTSAKSPPTLNQEHGKPPQSKVIEGVQAEWLRGIASKVLSQPEASVIFLNTSSGQTSSREVPARKQFIKIIPVDFYLSFDRPFSNQTIALYLQVASPKPGELLKSNQLLESDPIETPAKLRWEYHGVEGWRSLSVEDGTQNLSQRGMVQFIGPSDHALQTLFGQSGYWLRLRLMAGAFQIQPRLQQVLTNTVWAIQATTHQNEVLGSGTGDPNLILRTLHTPVLPGQQLLVREPELPSAEEQIAIKKLEGNDAIAISTDASRQPEDIWVRWHEVSDFYASGSHDRHYILDRMTGEIRFGGEGQGLAPPRGRNNIRMARYQSGGGKQGNCEAETLAELKTTVPYVDRVTNHEPANGGADLESIAAVQVSAPKQLRHRDRAVTWQDIEDLTYAASSEIARVKVITPKFDPVLLPWIPIPKDQASRSKTLAEALPSEALKQADTATTTVLIVPHGQALQPTPSLALIEQVKRYLGDRISPSLKLQVTEPVWVKVTVTATIAPISFQAANSLEATVKAALTDFLHPLTGGTRGRGWPFGREPHNSDLYARIERIPDVSHVESLRIESSIAALAPDDRDRFLIYSGQHQITLASPP